jgi:hypothetical protein
MELKTYKELQSYIEMFKKQKIDLLIIMSRGGLGKTTTLKNTMGKDDYVYINTHSTPLRTFQLLHEKRDCPVIFDDIEHILKNHTFVSLLKALSDTSDIKNLHYSTTSKAIGNVPETFATTSNVCILVNEFSIKNPILAPLLDRGYYVEFNPTKEEVLKKIEEIEKSQNIANLKMPVLDFIKENAHKIEKLSIRTYIKAVQLYNYDQSKWKEWFMKEIGFDEKAIDYIKLKELYKTDEERVAHYKWSRATYFRVKGEVESK